jgi:hypothetical protein
VSAGPGSNFSLTGKVLKFLLVYFMKRVAQGRQKLWKLRGETRSCEADKVKRENSASPPFAVHSITRTSNIAQLLYDNCRGEKANLLN